MIELNVSSIAPGARVLVMGVVDTRTQDALHERNCDVYAYPLTNGRSGSKQFDAVLVTEFREAWGHPAELLRELRTLLKPEGKVALFIRGIGPAAIRVATYGESDGETTAPLLRDEDVELSAGPAAIALLVEAGYRAVPGTERRSWVEGVAAAGAFKDSGEQDAAETSSDGRRLVHALQEIEELRKFFATMHEGQRRVHEELARLRTLLAQRDKTLLEMQAELDRARALAAVSHERAVALGRANGQLAEMSAQLADAEGRRVRLAAAVAELRERIHTSSE